MIGVGVNRPRETQERNQRMLLRGARHWVREQHAGIYTSTSPRVCALSGEQVRRAMGRVRVRGTAMLCFRPRPPCRGAWHPPCGLHAMEQLVLAHANNSDARALDALDT